MTRIGNRLGLSSKLNLSILVMAIPIFLLSMGLLFLQSRNDIFQEGEQSAFSALNTSMQQVRKYMLAVETATNSNLWLIEENFQPDSLLAISNRIVRLNIHVSGCSITAEPNMFPSVGRYFSAYTIREGDSIVTQREAEYDYYNKEWYSAPIEQGKACWIDPFDDYTEGTLSNNEIIASYSKPIYKDEQIVGVISSDLSLNSLDRVINTVTPPYPSAYFVLIGGDGSYLTHPDSTLLFSKSDYIDHIAGRQGTKHLLHNGRMCQVSYQPIEGTDIYEIGKRTVEAFEAKGRFFHFEFMRLDEDHEQLGKKGDLVGLEVNMRAPGAYIPDMMNFCYDVDVYTIWADMLLYDKCYYDIERKYYVEYAGRRKEKAYALTTKEIYDRHGDHILQEEYVPDALAEAMGHHIFIYRTDTVEEMKKIRHDILMPASEREEFFAYEQLLISQEEMKKAQEQAENAKKALEDAKKKARELEIVI